MKNVSSLALLGFSHHEADIYESLVVDGPETLAGLAKRVGIHRPTASQALKALAGRKAVMVKRRGKRTFFVAMSPAILRANLQQVIDEGQETLAELEQTFSLRNDGFDVRILEGKEPIRALFLELVETLGRDEVFYRYIACDASIDVESFVPPMYRPIRDKKGIQQCAITSAVMKGKPYKKGMGCLWKTLPEKEDRFAHGMAQLTFRDKVVFIDYLSEKAMVVQHSRFADFQRSIHKALYARLEERVT